MIESFSSFTKRGIVDLARPKASAKSLISWETIEREILEEAEKKVSDLELEDGKIFPWKSSIVLQPAVSGRSIDAVSIMFSAVLRILNESSANPNDHILVSWRRSSDPEKEIRDRNEMAARRIRALDVVHLASERRLKAEREAKRLANLANLNPEDRAS